MYYILSYKLCEDYINKRELYRSEHFDYVHASMAKGVFLMGGALEPTDEALLIFKVADKKVVQDFAKNDPYVLNDIVTSWSIRKWHVAIGGSK